MVFNSLKEMHEYVSKQKEVKKEVEKVAVKAPAPKKPRVTKK